MFPSYWIDDLIENPNGSYKFGSVEIVNDQHINVINRQTYSILDWLGDIGGLNDALLIIFQWLILPFLRYNQASVVMHRLFKFKP